jgi:protease I
MKVAFLAADMVEQVELTEPWKAVEQEGWDAELVSIQPGTIQAAQHFDKGDRFPVDRVVGDVDANDYDALVVPGGVANPDLLRTVPDAVAFVRDFFEQGKPMAVICHGPWMLVEADVARGRRVTSWPSLRTDLRNAGAEWEDSPVVVDEGLVTSRKPDDLPQFCAKLVEEFREGRHERQRTLRAVG